MANSVSAIRPSAALSRPEPQRAPPSARPAQDAQSAPQPAAQETPRPQAASAPRQAQETQQLQKQSAAEQAKSVQQEGFVRRVEEATKAVLNEIQGKVGTQIDVQA